MSLFLTPCWIVEWVQQEYQLTWTHRLLEALSDLHVTHTVLFLKMRFLRKKGRDQCPYSSSMWDCKVVPINYGTPFIGMPIKIFTSFHCFDVVVLLF